MLVHTAIADEFPLLAAIARELGEGNRGTEMAQLRTARWLLGDAFRSFDRTADIVDGVPLANGLRRCA